MASAFSLAAAAPPCRDEATTKDAAHSLFELFPAKLGPCVAEDMPRHDRLLQLALLLIVVVAKAIFTAVFLIERAVPLFGRLLPREYFLDQ